MRQDGLLTIYDESDLTSLSCKKRSDLLCHQTGHLKAIKTKGWDIHFRGGSQRFYGDGVYFSTGPFWPTSNGSQIHAKLCLDNHRHFPTEQALVQYITALGLNKYSHQPRITGACLAEGVNVISFPENVGDSGWMEEFGQPQQLTFVAYDPSVISIMDIRP